MKKIFLLSLMFGSALFATQDNIWQDSIIKIKTIKEIFRAIRMFNRGTQPLKLIYQELEDFMILT